MDKQKAKQNDWDNEDNDDWDDWGDAEDNFENEANVVQQNNNELAQAMKLNETTKDSNSNQEPSKVESPSVETNRSNSWASMFKPFGGVVTSITTSVSQGINQVIGVPDPEELARLNAAEAAKAKELAAYNEPDNKVPEDHVTTSTAPIFGMDLVNGVTTLGSKVLNTGLDTLEGIGKKTMTILQENDALLINKRKLLGLETERPNLSEVLKEAKKDADQLEHTIKQLQIEKTKTALRFESLFENNCGLVHLEALEILSKESTLKLQKLFDAISGQALIDLKETTNEVKELIEMEDLEAESDGTYTSDELNKLLATAIEDVDLKISFDDIVKIWADALTWLENSNSENVYTAEELFVKGIKLQAETCALEMNKLHKIAELLLVKEHHSTANEVDCVVKLCKEFNLHLNGLTNRFATALTALKDDEAKTFLNTLFSEMLLATQHIEKAFKLFLPILQIGAV